MKQNIVFFGLMAVTLLLTGCFSSTPGLILSQDINKTTEDFNELNDTPANYIGSGGKCVAVKGAETGLEFVVCSAGGGGVGDGNFYSIDDFNELYWRQEDANLTYWKQVDLNNLLQFPDFNGMIKNFGENLNWQLDTNWSTEFPIFDANIRDNFYDKNEVNDLFLGSSLSLYLTNNLRGIADYNRMKLIPSLEAESVIKAQITASGQQVAAYATENDFNLSTLKEGVYDIHIHASKTNTKTTKLYWELYKRTQIEDETLLITSELSQAITGTDVAYEIHGILPTEQQINKNDILILKVIANLEGGGSNPTVSILQEGEEASRLSIRVTSDFFSSIYYKQEDLNKLIQVPDFNGMLQNFGEGQGWDASTIDTNYVTSSSDFNAQYNLHYIQFLNPIWNLSLPADWNTLYLDTTIPDTNYVTSSSDFNAQYDDRYSKISDTNGEDALKAYILDVNGADELRALITDVNGADNLRALISDVNGADELRALISDVNGADNLRALITDVNGADELRALITDVNGADLLRLLISDSNNNSRLLHTVIANAPWTLENIFTQGSYSVDTNSWLIDLNVGGNNVINVNDVNATNINANFVLIQTGDMNFFIYDKNIIAETALGRIFWLPDQNCTCIGTETIGCNCLTCNGGDCNYTIEFR